MALRKALAAAGMVFSLAAFAGIRTSPEVVLHTSVIANDGVRTEANQALTPNRKLTACVGQLRSRTPLEPNSSGSEHLVNGAFCDGLVVQAKLVEERQNGALVDWQLRSNGRSPSDKVLSQHEFLRFDSPVGVAAAQCNQLDVAHITFSIHSKSQGGN